MQSDSIAPDLRASVRTLSGHRRRVVEKGRSNKTRQFVGVPPYTVSGGLIRRLIGNLRRLVRFAVIRLVHRQIRGAAGATGNTTRKRDHTRKQEGAKGPPSGWLLTTDQLPAKRVDEGKTEDRRSLRRRVRDSVRIAEQMRSTGRRW